MGSPVETAAADLRGWLARLGLPVRAVAALMGVSPQTVDNHVERGAAPRLFLLAAERVERLVTGVPGPDLAPSPAPGHPAVAEAARLMLVASAVDDPADLYDVADIVAGVPALLAGAVADLPQGDRRTVRAVLAEWDAEDAAEDAWRCWRATRLLRRWALSLCAVGGPRARDEAAGEVGAR